MALTASNFREKSWMTHKNRENWVHNLVFKYILAIKIFNIRTSNTISDQTPTYFGFSVQSTVKFAKCRLSFCISRLTFSKGYWNTLAHIQVSFLLLWGKCEGLWGTFYCFVLHSVLSKTQNTRVSQLYCKLWCLLPVCFLNALLSRDNKLSHWPKYKTSFFSLNV